MDSQPQRNATDNDRWSKIIRWLKEHRAEICMMDKGHVRITFAGKHAVSFEISRWETVER